MGEGKRTGGREEQLKTLIFFLILYILSLDNSITTIHILMSSNSLLQLKSLF